MKIYCSRENRYDFERFLGKDAWVEYWYFGKTAYIKFLDWINREDIENSKIRYKVIEIEDSKKEALLEINDNKLYHYTRLDTFMQWVNLHSKFNIYTDEEMQEIVERLF